MALESPVTKPLRHYGKVDGVKVTPLCGGVGLTRQTKTNVNCEACLEILDGMDDDEEDPEVAAEEDAEAREERLSEMMVSAEGLPPHTRNDECDTLGCVPLRPKTVSDYEDEVEKLYLVCNGCGEAFDSIEAAQQHGTADLSGSAGWCGEDGFVIQPESEAM